MVSGCASTRSILYAGYTVGALQHRVVVSDAAANQDVHHQLARWVADIERRGREAPRPQFANLSMRNFRRRLAAAAAEYHFTVRTVQFFNPRQLAPLVVLRSRRYVALAHAIASIERSLNPQRAFEAFFLEAQDERGVPFLTPYDALRGPSGYGGQWARSDALLPFAHG